MLCESLSKSFGGSLGESLSESLGETLSEADELSIKAPGFGSDCALGMYITLGWLLSIPVDGLESEDGFML